MSKYTYRPMLRSKAGEVTALSGLEMAAKDRLKPVFHLVHKPAASFVGSIVSAWPGRSMALDGSYQFWITGSVQGYVQMFDQIGKGGVGIIPSVEYGADPIYVAAAGKLR